MSLPGGWTRGFLRSFTAQFIFDSVQCCVNVRALYVMISFGVKLKSEPEFRVFSLQRSNKLTRCCLPPFQLEGILFRSPFPIPAAIKMAYLTHKT